MLGCGSKKPVDETYQRFSKSKKLLLLGTGESGKTTIIKQMKILHINGFSDSEKRDKIPYIRRNVHESIYDIVNNMDKIDPIVVLETSENEQRVHFILTIGPLPPSDYSEEYYDTVQKLWKDNGVQRTFQRSNEYQLIDCAQHFLDQIDIIRRPDYIPTTQDILFCRIRTTSISEIEFNVPVPVKYGGGTANFLMYDVGGQRGERRKWIQVFDGIDAVLFIIAASDFDQTLREDETKNRLEEALTVFKDMCTSRFLRNAGMIVFLNKQDVLQSKIENGRKLEKYFPKFSEFIKPNLSEYERANAFLDKTITDISKTEVTLRNYDQFKGQVVIEKLPPKDIYIHQTIATDTKNIKKVFQSVHQIILQQTIDSIGNY